MTNTYVAFDFVHVILYGAAITLLLQIGTIAAYGPSIARAVREKRELHRLRADIDAELERVLPTRHGPRDHKQALIAGRAMLDAVRNAARDNPA
jgi:type II secretory pathway component PulM